jgi:hypothetical protein
MNTDLYQKPCPPVTEGEFKAQQQQPPAGEPLDFSTMRYLNETAIRDHALRCSARFRANKFTRVGQDFIDEVKADAEAVIRSLRTMCPTKLHDPLEPDKNNSCITGLFCDRVGAEFNRLVCRIIQNKVQRQPTVGKTLSRTR